MRWRKLSIGELANSGFVIWVSVSECGVIGALFDIPAGMPRPMLDDGSRLVVKFRPVNAATVSPGQ